MTAIAGGQEHSLALKNDGTVVAWGNNDQGQSSAPGGLISVTAIEAGSFHSLALVGSPISVPEDFGPKTVAGFVTNISPGPADESGQTVDFIVSNLTVAYSSGGGAEDQLSIRNQGTSGGQIGFSSGTVTYGGLTIGTMPTSGTGSGINGTTLIVTFATANATPAAIQALIANLTYENTSNTPTPSRTISVTVNDGDGGTSAAQSAQMNVTAEEELIVAITSFTPTSAAVGATVTINGSNFDSTSANNIVFFGAVKATVTAATAAQLTVTVPTGATYGPITVSTPTGLSASSNSRFVPTFSGGGIVDASSFATKVDLTVGSQPHFVQIGDLDGDGKPDLAVSNNLSLTVSVLRNVSSAGTLDSSSFQSRVDITVGSNPIQLQLADFDGDGKLDLAVENETGNVVVLRNTAAPGTLDAGSFAAVVNVASVSGSQRIAIGDVNGDGKLDLVIAGFQNNTVSVRLNISTSGSITSASFATRVDFAAGLNPRIASIADLDGDGRPDILVPNEGSGTISILRNIVRPQYAWTTLAGVAGSSGSTDGTGSAARFSAPWGVGVDSAGNLYVADRTSHTIRKVTSDGMVSTLAGLAGTSGSTDGTGSAARFNHPEGVAVDDAGNVYVADTDNSAVRKVTPGGVVSTFAGSAASLSGPQGVAVDGAGNVFVADTGHHTIRKITSGGTVSTLAGATGTSGSTDGTGTAARFNNPFRVAVDSAGSVYVADTLNSTIRIITPAGVVSTLAGLAGNNGSTDGTGSAARFFYPHGLVVDSSGNVYVTDGENNTLRKGTPATTPIPNLPAEVLTSTVRVPIQSIPVETPVTNPTPPSPPPPVIAPSPAPMLKAVPNARPVRLSVATVAGKTYILEYKENLAARAWTRLTSVEGDGQTRFLVDPDGERTQRFYRVRVE